MTAKRAKLRRGLAGIVAALMLGGCVVSGTPLLAGGRPVLGCRLPVHLVARADGPACGPDVDPFRCGGAQYAGSGRPTLDITIVTLARYRGADRPVQARSSPPQVKGIAYPVAREAANGVYLTSGIDEQDGNKATRAKFCTNDPTSSRSMTRRDALMVFVEATALRPDRMRHWRSSSTGAGASA